VKQSVPPQLDSNPSIISSSVKQSVPAQLDSNPSIKPSSVKQSVPAQLDSNPSIKPIPPTTKTAPVVSNPNPVIAKSNPQTSKPEILSERQSNKPLSQSTTTKIIKSSTTNSHTHSSATNKDQVTTITKTRRAITARKTVPGPRYETKSSDQNHNNKPIVTQRNDRGEKEVKRVEGPDKNERKGESGQVGNIERRKLTNPVTPEFVRREQRKKLLKQQANRHSPTKTNATDKSRPKSTLHM